MFHEAVGSGVPARRVGIAEPDAGTGLAPPTRARRRSEPDPSHHSTRGNGSGGRVVVGRITNNQRKACRISDRHGLVASAPFRRSPAR